MLIKLDYATVYELTDRDLTILLHKFLPDELNPEIVRRLAWSLEEMLKESKKRILAENLEALKSNYSDLPTDNEALIDMILADPNYQDKAAKQAAATTDTITTPKFG